MKPVAQTLIPEWALPLTGRSTEHLIHVTEKFFLTQKTASAFKLLQDKASHFGIDLQIISAFRSYERQEQIWNKKIEKGLSEGKKPPELFHDILRWSALPGTSRHHWGTDLDVFDARMMEKSQVKLEPHEYEAGGPFHELTQFLNQHMQEFGFYRPYDQDRKGVSPELWHLSFKAEANLIMEKYNFDIFQKNILSSNILLKDQISPIASDLYHRYFINIS
jgi:LAS superfamily LD-carboxypeptidase LdcB